MKAFFKGYAGLFVLCIGTSHAVAQQEDIYDKAHSLDFADYLMAAHEYQSAAIEYERLVFLDSANDSLRLRLLRAYRLGNAFSKGVSRFEDFYSPISKDIPGVFAREYVKLLLLQKDYGKSRNFLTISQKLPRSYKANVELGILLLEKEWPEAQAYSITSDVNDPYLESLASRGVDLKHKSPVLASVFSAVVPGSGKMYTGNWGDGVIAFLFVGANAFAAYRGFSRNGADSFYGWFFTAMGTGFYVGNIYGSYRSAEDYNIEKENLLHHEVEDYFYTRY